jgi:hypothetical protein
MPWRSWFQLVFGPTESKRWNGFDARTEARSHRIDSADSIHLVGRKPESKSRKRSVNSFVLLDLL